MSAVPLPRLSGRTVVITGASAGLGAAAARRFAAAGARVLPVGRSVEKTRALAEEIGAPVLTADFAVLDDVRQLAEEVLQHCDRIDVLANNAGGGAARRHWTVDGHERTFQVNHLAPFLLTALLRERLESTGGARVVTTTSDANRVGRVDLEDLDSRSKRYRFYRVYATTKLLNVLFTRELARRLGGGATASCFHPGTVSTEIARDSATGGLVFQAFMLPFNSPLRRLMLSPDQGADALLHLAVRAEAHRVNGDYFERFGPGRAHRQADDAALARAVWERSAQLVGVPA